MGLESLQTAYSNDLSNRIVELDRAMHANRLEDQAQGDPSDDDFARYSERYENLRNTRSGVDPSSQPYDHRSTTRPLPERRSPSHGHINHDLPDDLPASTRNTPKSRPYRRHGYQRAATGTPSTENPQLTPPSATENMYDLPEEDVMARFHMPRPPRAVNYEGPSEQGPSTRRSPKLLPEGWSWHPGYPCGLLDKFMEGPHWCYTTSNGATRPVMEAPPEDEVSPSRHYRYRLGERRSVSADESGRLSPLPLPYRPDPRSSRHQGDERFLDRDVPFYDSDDFPPMPRHSSQARRRRGPASNPQQLAPPRLQHTSSADPTRAPRPQTSNRNTSIQQQESEIREDLYEHFFGSKAPRRGGT